MSVTTRRRSGLGAELVLLWAGIGVVVAGTGLVTAAVHLGHRLAGVETDVPRNPFEVVVRVLDGTLTWPAESTGVALAVVAAVVGLAVAGHQLARRRGGRSARVDRAAGHMGRGGALHQLTARGAGETARRLGVTGPVGLPIGRALDGRPLYQDWESVSVDIAGPRTGKTSSRVIPVVLEAPGAVLATSNKRDVVDATRQPRAALGDVWVFDPQGIAGEEPTWWWDPLSYVSDEVRARILADVFASSSRDVTARADAYFDGAALDLLAALLHAAALAGRPITQVYHWLTDPTDDEAAHVLREHDVPLSARVVQQAVGFPERQRGGIYGTAQQMTSVLTNRAATRWVTPVGPEDPRPRFDPAALVRSADGASRRPQTLYSLSREGRGSAGALVAALTVAVTEAAEEHARRQPRGRLATPLVAALDEAANVVRWRELPNMYSHYGSRGIAVLTFLQSWSQGVDVWGREGMRKLWSAANVRVYGGGVTEAEFANDLAQLVGDYEHRSVSTSHGRGGRQTSRSGQKERILDVADLAALPRGRAVVLASGTPATLVRTVPWTEGRRAGEVRASIAAHDPAGAATSTTDPEPRDET